MRPFLDQCSELNAVTVHGFNIHCTCLISQYFSSYNRRTRSPRSSLEIKPPPAKEDLANIEASRNTAQNENEGTAPKNGEPTGTNEGPTHQDLYGNVDKNGSVNPHTDPSVGQDGYLRKAGYVEESHVTHAPQRVTSMPMSQAPPPPVPAEDGDSYVKGRVNENSPKQKGRGYVNLRGNVKGEPVFGVSPKPVNKTKVNKAKNGTDYEMKYTDPPEQCDNSSGHYYNEPPNKLYANVNNGQQVGPTNYYNVTGESATDRGQDLVEEVVYDDN